MVDLEFYILPQFCQSSNTLWSRIKENMLTNRVTVNFRTLNIATFTTRIKVGNALDGIADVYIIRICIYFKLHSRCMSTNTQYVCLV